MISGTNLFLVKKREKLSSVELNAPKALAILIKAPNNDNIFWQFVFAISFLKITVSKIRFSQSKETI